MSRPAAEGEEPSRLIAVGRISSAHGVKGELSVLPLSQVPERFQKGSRLLLDEQGSRWLTVVASRPHRQRLLISFGGIADRTTAESLVGRYLFVPAGSAPPLPAGEFWTHELVGCRVVTESGRELGTIREVIHTQANDVWAAAGEGEVETLIPALKEVVAEVELAERRVVVREIPGLTAP